MYRRAFSIPSSLRWSAGSCIAASRHIPCYTTVSNHRPRNFSAPTHTPESRHEPALHAESSSPSKTEDAPVSTLKSTAIPPPQPGDPAQTRTRTKADQLDGVKARLRGWSHDTLKGMRQRGDEFTARVARTFAQLGSELNRVTGYEEIEVLKRKVVEQEARIYNAREAARQAKDAYDTAVLQRAKSQREVNDLLQRKSHWTDEDVSRFTTLVREDHAREHDEARAKAAAAAAEDAVEREFSELMRVILNRYHEEQAWSDKIRSASTYGSLAALALNMAVFVLAIVLVEPWKRRRLAQTFERKVEEMGAQTVAALEAKTTALADRMDEQAKMLSTMLEAVHLATQVSATELEDVDAGAEWLESARPEESGRTSRPRSEQELLLAVTASAAAAGVFGWVARSWFG